MLVAFPGADGDGQSWHAQFLRALIDKPSENCRLANFVEYQPDRRFLVAVLNELDRVVSFPDIRRRRRRYDEYDVRTSDGSRRCRVFEVGRRVEDHDIGVTVPGGGISAPKV